MAARECLQCGLMRTLRLLTMGGLLAALAACGQGSDVATGEGGDKDYLSMKPEEVCKLLTVDEASQAMKPITTDELTASGEQQNSLPACRYGAGEGKAYLLLSIHQSSAMGGDEDAEKVTVAGKEALQTRPSTGCSVAVPLDDQHYLLAIAESWKSDDEESCQAATEALEKAYPRLSN